MPSPSTRNPDPQLQDQPNQTFPSNMNHIDFTITQSSIDHGRLYFEGVPKGFFPPDAVGGRGAAEHAPTLVTIVAGGDSVDTDIRENSAVRLSPRKSFSPWLRSVRAIAGGTAHLVRTGDRTYSLQYKG